MIKTVKVTDRRPLRFSTLPEVLADVERLDAGGSLSATGNWTPAQIVQHVTKLIKCSFDGFPVPRAALPLRVVGRLLRNRALSKAMRPGFKLPGKFSFLAPDEQIAWDDAVRDLRETLARLDGERMTVASPVLGPLNHEQWEQLHCRHAEMHLSFVRGRD
jgi:hypothetical protein